MLTGVSKKTASRLRKAAVMLYNLRKQSAPSFEDVFLGAFNCGDHFHSGRKVIQK